MISLTKKEEKLIVSLQQKKFRREEGLFLVEGEKMVNEALLSDFEVELVVISGEIEIDVKEEKLRSCDAKSMKRISSFTTPPGILAVIHLPKNKETISSEITLLLDRIQDPGNVGTIIRTADALGVNTIIYSDDTADIFNPKVVQATMGSIFRISFKQVNLIEFLERKEDCFPIYAAHLKGDNLYQKQIKPPCYLLMGNESRGIQDELIPYVTDKIKIPMKGSAESLNVSIATAIILGEFRRQLS